MAAPQHSAEQDQWVSLADGPRPTLADEDCLGDVVFLRSGAWECLGRLSRGIPVDASAWKHTARWASEKERNERVRDTDRLLFLLLRLPGDELRRAVGILDDTGDIEGFRRAVDRELPWTEQCVACDTVRLLWLPRGGGLFLNSGALYSWGLRDNRLMDIRELIDSKSAQ